MAEVKPTTSRYPNGDFVYTPPYVWTNSDYISTSSITASSISSLTVAIYCVRCHPTETNAKYMLNGNSYCEKHFAEVKKEAVLFDRL